MKFVFCLCVLVMGLALPLRAADDDVQPIEGKDLFTYLDQSITWYHAVTGIDASHMRSRDVLFNNSLQQAALKVLRNSFDFARIEGAVLESQKEAAEAKAKAKQEAQAEAEAKAELAKTEVSGNAQTEDKPKEAKPGAEPNLDRIKIMIAQKRTRIENDLAQTQADLTKARGTARDTLSAKRDKLSAELNLTQMQQELIETISTSEEKDNEEVGLLTQIDNLASGIPGLNKKKTTSTSTATTTGTDKPATTTSLPLALPVPAASSASSTTDDAAESKGIIRLIGDMIAQMRRKQTLSDLKSQTDNMVEAHDAMLGRVRDQLMVVVRRANTLAQDGDGANAQNLEAERQELVALADQFKQISPVLVPLSDQKKPLATCLRTIAEWQGAFGEEMREIFNRLVLHLLGLAVAIIIPLGISEFARRASIKYVRDAKRRRQLNIIRRVLVSIMIGLVIALNLLTEFGSLATFIGFVTAGVAVALQNVILSVAAYFFFFGRYGIRVGSRVSVYGTTGEVIETGLVRLYMMELSESDGKWQPTGRIVAFPNSILFQPTAFFKQVPGAKFQQHEMTILLKEDTDREIAEARIKEAARTIEDDSRPILESQKIALEQSTHIKAKIPKPKGGLREVDGQLALVMRYPVAADRADNIDQNVSRLILETLERDPAVQRLNNDSPSIKPV